MTRLNKIWENCLRMWKWISENLPNGFMKLNSDERRLVVHDLKKEWIKKYHYKDITFYCFFCDYSHDSGVLSCENCPAKKIEYRLGNYWCERKYHWSRNPVNFYQYLLKLDAKREENNSD